MKAVGEKCSISSVNIYVIFILCCATAIAEGILERKQHQTNASLESKSDLTCFVCNSINVGVKCTNLSLRHNKTEFHKKCHGDKKCMVRKISYTTSTENSTSQMRVWSLERKCTNKCEEGCIVIGERTKVHACSACCSQSLCNVTNGVQGQNHRFRLFLGAVVAVVHTLSLLVNDT